MKKMEAQSISHKWAAKVATHDILFRGFKESVCKSDGERSIVARKYEVACRSRREASAVRGKWSW